MKIVWIVLLALAGSCAEKKNCEVKNRIEISFTSLEDSLPVMARKHQLIQFLSRHPDIRDLALNRRAYPDDSAFYKKMSQRFSHPSMDTLRMEVKKVFGDGQELKQEFANAFTRIQQTYPSFRPPKVKTILTGMETDIVASDTLVIAGLDFFLGPQAKYRPNMYDYMLKRYEKNFVVPSVILLIAMDRHFNAVNSDQTILSDMIAYGKAYYFASQMMPCVADSVWMGYSSEEMKGVLANEKYIWKKLVENEVFYKDNFRIKQKYIAERPKTPEISADCPGRIGTWVGWQIVKAYARQHTELSLPEIMKISDSNLIFKESKYKPE